MNRKAVVSFGLLLVCVALSVFMTSEALAQNPKTEATAKALQKKAMEEDYLATEFTKAQDKLDKAIAACGADKCSAGTRAQLKRDLGVVQIGGQLAKENGIDNFGEAIKLDAAIAPERDARTEDTDEAWAEAKKRAGGGGATPQPSGRRGQPSGDFIHVPAPHQQVRKPIPVYREYSGAEQLLKVNVR